MSERARIGRRFALAAGFYVVAVAGYLGSGWATLGASVEVRPLALDRLVPFEPRLAPVYLAYFPYLLWILARLARRPELPRLLALASAVLAVSLLCFALAPTHVVRAVPSGAGLWEGWVRAIQRVDPPTNALPSLHASLTVLASWVAWRKRLLPGWVGIVATALILYAALALKQHLVLDLVAGAVLGLAAALLAERLERRPLPSPVPDLP